MTSNAGTVWPRDSLPPACPSDVPADLSTGAWEGRGTGYREEGCAVGELVTAVCEGFVVGNAVEVKSEGS